MLTVPGFLAILIMTVPESTSWDCPSPCRCRNDCVDCSNKDLTKLDENMFNWTGAEQLPQLSLEKNQLTSLPAHIFDPLWKLTALNLNHNQLQVLEISLFSKLRHLKFLDLRDNQLATLPVGLFAVQNELISLDLRDNSLSTLDVNVLNPMRKLKILNISGNPLYCDCSLQPVVKWSSDMLEYTDAKCHLPPQYMDHSWYNLKNIECTTLLSAVTISPSTDTTPGFQNDRSTTFTNKYTAEPPNTKNQPPFSMRHDDSLYVLSIVLIALLIVLSLVLIGTMVFISVYKRLKGLSSQVQYSSNEL